jgi:hypothetical protein
VAPERKRSARDYEQALRRQELAAGRALVQALPAEGPPGPRELAAARRVLTGALFELRRLGRDLDREIEGLQSRRPARAPRGSGPGELDRFEAVRNAVEEVAERWEGRRDQLSAELERRQPRQARRPGQGSGGAGRASSGGTGRSAAGRTGAPGAGTGTGRHGRGAGAQGGRGGREQPPRGTGRARDGEVRGRRGGSPARPERPRSPRSRRSPG